MSFQLMIHGGAGTVPNKKAYAPHIENILQAGQKALAQEQSAIDVVELCVMLLEDDPTFNAGKGSVLNHKGTVDMDAAIMDGSNMSAGSVAGIQYIANPIHLARYVRDYSDHVMLIGEGAMEFAQLHQFSQQPLDYFITERRYNQWLEAQKSDTTSLDHSHSDKKMGTVGAVARDIHGNLAAATSTGGITNKKFGRVGDTPLIGAGVFAENETCAVSATGYGEQFIRTTLSRTVSEFIRYRGMTAQEASQAAINYLVDKVNGIGGIITIDYQGNLGSAHSSQDLLHGKATESTYIVLT